MAERGGTTDKEELRGTIDRITFHSDETLYAVLRINPEKGYGNQVGQGLYAPLLVTAVGKIDQPAEGLRVHLHGRWTVHKAHGPQFEFDDVVVLPPAGVEGAVRYLASERFPGIGEVLARRVVEALQGAAPGADPFQAIADRPELLDGVKGLKPPLKELLVGVVRADLGTHQVHAFLRGGGLGPAQAAAIVKKFGHDCEGRLRENPYLIAHGVRGIGFGVADKLALGLGITVDDPRRARAATLHALESAADDGHSCLVVDELVERARATVREEIPEPVVREAVADLARDKDEGLVVEQCSDGATRAWLPWLAASESGLARRAKELLHAPPVPALATARELADHERRVGIELHPLQREAVLGLLSRPMALLTGGPGVGKTTITRFVVALAKQSGARVLLASPTGRAAKRMAEATGAEAQTIHRMLGWNPQDGAFLHDRKNPLQADLVVVDEISMLDVALAHHLAKATQAPTRLVLIGDPDQLPSVGPGNVLADLLASGVVPTWRLTHIYRQGAASLIKVNAHHILRGEELELPARGDLAGDFYHFVVDDPAECAERLVEVVTRRIPERFGLDWVDDVQVVAPMYRGECGVDALNERLRQALGSGGREVRLGSRTWRVGDRVIHVRNDYEKEVYNGDMGRIVRVDDDGSLAVRYPERVVEYEPTELGDLQSAFAITVHRSQGGEFPAVVVPLATQHALMLQRNLLYTAVTRARKLCVLVGSRRALHMALSNVERARRESFLARRLRDMLAPAEA
ncbi:MAG: ATP-dependent RecD-like DNA helicase [Planctomycetia bacterium]